MIILVASVLILIIVSLRCDIENLLIEDTGSTVVNDCNVDHLREA